MVYPWLADDDTADDIPAYEDTDPHIPAVTPGRYQGRHRRKRHGRVSAVAGISLLVLAGAGAFSFLGWSIAGASDVPTSEAMIVKPVHATAPPASAAATPLITFSGLGPTRAPKTTMTHKPVPKPSTTTPAPAPTVTTPAPVPSATTPAPAPTTIAPAATTTGYACPVSGLSEGRVDEGVDFSGAGDIKAIGNGTVTEVYGSGWPGGVYLAYTLADGADAGMQVYVAEDLTPDVSAGATVYPGTVIGYAYGGADGIETGISYGYETPMAMHLGEYAVDGSVTAQGTLFQGILSSLCG